MCLSLSMSSYLPINRLKQKMAKTIKDVLEFSWHQSVDVSSAAKQKCSTGNIQTVNVVKGFIKLSLPFKKIIVPSFFHLNRETWVWSM